MFDGQVIIATTSATSVYSPWFARGGDHAVFTLEVAAWSESSASTKLKIEAYHKAKEESGDGSAISESIEIPSNSASPRSSKDWASNTFKDLVRFKITFTPSSGTQWAIYRILPPIWYDAAKPA